MRLGLRSRRAERWRGWPSWPWRSGLPGLLAAALMAGACAGTGPGASAAGGSDAAPIEVVTSTTVFADMVQQVGGSLVHVTSLVPRNADVHTFAPRPSDVTAVARARLIVMNGLGLDDWLDRTITNAAASGTPVVKLAVDLPDVALLPGEDPGSENPHLWLDVRYAELYVSRIAAGLARVDPVHEAAYNDQAGAYQGRLQALDEWVRQQIATIGPADRKIVTFHDAFPYFAREYGITIVGVAVKAPGQDPSAAYTAQLIDAIRRTGVRAIFSEQQFPARLVDQIAAQTGATVVSTLYDDALGDPPVTSFEALIRWDVKQIVGALRGGTGAIPGGTAMRTGAGRAPHGGTR